MQLIVAPFAPRCLAQINGSRLVCHNWGVSGVPSVHYPFCTGPWQGRMSRSLARGRATPYSPPHLQPNLLGAVCVPNA